MKKIMFNDKYGLTQAVLKSKKTMTRRIINDDFEDVKAYNANGDWHFIADTEDGDSIELNHAYEVGEVVAVAQSYKDIRDIIGDVHDGKSIKFLKGWNNKMFVRADLMPHHIRITNIKVERLQDISDDDCMKEGIYEDAEEHGGLYTTPFYDFHGNTDNGFYEPREAFAALIDRISGEGTWKRNPWVFAYEFEKID